MTTRERNRSQIEAKLTEVVARNMNWSHLEASTAGTTVATFCRHLIFTAASYPAKQAGSPDSGNSPHANTPATIETLNALALLPLLETLSGGGVSEEVVCTLGVRRCGADTFLINNMPHSSNDTAVGARRGNDGFNI